MHQEVVGRSALMGPLTTLRKVVPFDAVAASDRLGWVGMQAARYRDVPGSDLSPPALSHPRLVLFSRPPERLDLRFEGVERHVPPPVGSIAVIPAGSPVWWRWSGRFDWLCIFLESGLISRVAEETFGLDPARIIVPALDGLDLPQLRASMWAVDAELTAGAAGGQLAAESLANLVAVHLIRHALAPRRLGRGRDGALPQGRLRAVVAFIEEHLDSGPSLEQMAAVARLSTYHFARQFKAATGSPPHQYVIAQRVERAKHFLQSRRDLSLAEVAARSGFSDQSQFSRHFRRLVGVTPGHFRTSARFA